MWLPPLPSAMCDVRDGASLTQTKQVLYYWVTVHALKLHVPNKGKIHSVIQTINARACCPSSPNPNKLHTCTCTPGYMCTHANTAPPKEGLLNGRQPRCIPSFLWIVPSLIAKESPMAWAALLGGFVFGWPFSSATLPSHKLVPFHA